VFRRNQATVTLAEARLPAAERHEPTAHFRLYRRALFDRRPFDQVRHGPVACRQYRRAEASASPLSNVSFEPSKPLNHRSEAFELAFLRHNWFSLGDVMKFDAKFPNSELSGGVRQGQLPPTPSSPERVVGAARTGSDDRGPEPRQPLPEGGLRDLPRDYSSGVSDNIGVSINVRLPPGMNF
jgi:hypothetical protein